jgi:putative chitinase
MRKELLRMILPNALAGIAQCPAEVAQAWRAPLSDAMQAYAIDTSPRVAAFLGQVLHESAGLTRLTENLYYSAERLVQVWPIHFYLPPKSSPTRQDATQYAHRPEALANLIYADRMGNGPALSGDGWRFRGRGLIQLTGRTNYVLAGEALGINLAEDPDLLLLPEYAARSAAWFWSTVGGNALADQDTREAFEKLTVAINGEASGLQQRMDIWMRAKRVLVDGAA